MIPDSTTGNQEDSPCSEDEVTPPYRHLNLNEFLPINPIGISDEQLVSIPIKEINKSFKCTGLPSSDQTKMKKKRRTLKNRGYAETTRRKKEAEINQLEQELADLKNENLDMENEKKEMERLHEKLQHSNRIRLNWALKSNIPIPDDIRIQMMKIEANESCD